VYPPPTPTASAYDGCLGHEILQDVDDPGHLIVVSRWTNRARADEVLRGYVDTPNAATAKSLVSKPRRRILAEALNSPPS
jgi:quinol monooxygenase YgiN